MLVDTFVKFAMVITLPAMVAAKSLMISFAVNSRDTTSPTLAKVVEALFEYIRIGLITGPLRSISTLVPGGFVVVTTWVPTFPAKSTKSILKVTVPEGSLEIIALECASHKVLPPMVFEAFSVTVSAATPKMVILDVLVVMSSLALIAKVMVFPSFAFCESGP